MPNKSKMFLLSYLCWLCLFNSFLAYPLNQYREPEFHFEDLLSLADYPDLTEGLSDAELRAALKDLTLRDLKSLDLLITEHIHLRERAQRAYLSRMLASQKNFRAVDPTFYDGGREGNECEEPRPVSRFKPSPSPTTKHCVKTTWAPKTSRTTKPDCMPRTTKPSCVSRTTKPDCVPKTTTPNSSNDVFGKCPRVNVKNKRKKLKEDNECASDDFLCQARKRMEGRNIFQELGAPAKYTPPRELAGIEKIADQIIPSLNDQGEPIDEAIHLGFPKESSKLMELVKLHESLANHQASFEGEHQSQKLQHAANLNLDHEENINRELGFNLKEKPKAKVHQENLDNFQQDNWNLEEGNLANFNPYKWQNLDQTISDKIKLSNWARLNPANLANIEEASFDNWGTDKQSHQQHFSLEPNDNPEVGTNNTFQPAQAEQAAFQQGNQSNLKQDNQASLKQSPSAKLQSDNQAISEHENRANLKLQNQDSFKQPQQADLDNHQLHQQHKQLKSEVNFYPIGQQLSRKRKAEQEKQAFIPRSEQQPEVNYQPSPEQCNSNQPLTNQAELNKAEVEVPPLEPFEEQQLSRKRNTEQENQALMPKDQTLEEQRSQVEYQPNTEQWTPNQPLTNQAELNKMEGEALNPNDAEQLNQMINAEIEKPSEKRRAAIQKKEQVTNDKPQPVNADLTKQESNFEVDSFIAKSARDPPLYLSSMQDDLIQRETERRLNHDRSLSESLNLDKLTGEKEANPAGETDWITDNRRGKRENRSTDDAQENSRETYIKKLMDSFPRDQGSQINANVALKDCPFAHERMKRS